MNWSYSNSKYEEQTCQCPVQPGVSHLGSGLKKSTLCLAPPTWRKVRKQLTFNGAFKKKIPMGICRLPCPRHPGAFHQFPSSIREWYYTKWSSCQNSRCTHFMYRPRALSPPARKILVLFLSNSFCASVPAALRSLWHVLSTRQALACWHQPRGSCRRESARFTIITRWSRSRYLVLAFFLGCWLTGLPTVPFFTEPFRARSLCFSTKPQNTSV